MSTPIVILKGSLPADYCYPASPEQFLLDLPISGFLDQNFPGIFKGATAPTPSQRDRLWYNTNDGKWYSYFNGDWFRPSDSTAGPSGERMLWFDTEANLWSFQGGDGTNPSVVTPTLYTGSFWEVDHTFDARFPIGPGTLPSAAVIAQGSTGGAEDITLDVTQIPSHSHGKADNSSGYWTRADPVGSGTANVLGGTDTILSTQTGLTGGGLAHSNMGPFLGVFFAKRTIRYWTKV